MKTKLTSIILLLCMLLSSCGTTVVNTLIPKTDAATSSPESTVTEPTPVEPLPTKIEDIGQIVFEEQLITYDTRTKHYELYTYYHGQNFLYNKNNLPGIIEALEMDKTTILESLPKIINYNFLGRDFELEYVGTNYSVFKDNFTGKLVDTYVCSEKWWTLKVHFVSGTTQPYMFDFFSRDDDDVLGLESKTCSLDNLVDFINTFNEMYFKQYTDYEISFLVTGKEITKPRYYYNWNDINNLKNKNPFTEPLSSYYAAIEYHDNTNNAYNVSEYINFSVRPFWLYMFFGSTDLSEYNKPINLTTKEIYYAYNEVKSFINDNISDRVEYPKILQDTFNYTLSVLKGRLYLKVTVDVEAVWPDGDCEPNRQTLTETFFVDYERLQQKMALEGIKP